MTATLSVTAPARSDQQPDRSPLFLDGLVEFNQQRWGLAAERVRFAPDGDGGPAVEAVYYLNAKGLISKPPINPYLPVAFEPTPTQSLARLDRQWISVAGELAEDMRARGLSATIPLPPEVADVRPWQWAGFQADVRYTFRTNLPYDAGLMEPAVRRQIAKSERKGFRCERTTSIEDVFACVADTEERQGFSYQLTAADLTLAQSLIGEDEFRFYVCYAPNGEPASAWIVLRQPGGPALDWMNGTATAYLSSGATQQLLHHVLHDLHADGGASFDFVGASLPTVAKAKATWGVELTPFYTVDGGRLRAIARHGRDFLRFRRNGTASGNDAR